MFAGPLQILMIEDSPADAKLLEYELRRGGIEFESVRVETEPELLVALNTKFDVVLCDWQLPQFDCLRALTLLQVSQPDVPFIVVSGSIGEEAAVNAMKLGVADYLLKDRLGRLVPAVKQALEKRAIRCSVERATQALRLSESRLAEAQRIARLGSWGWEPVSGKIWWSDTMFALLGLNPATSEPTLETFLSVLHPDDRSAALRRTEAMQAACRVDVPPCDQRPGSGASDRMSPEDGFFAYDFRVIRPDGTRLWLHSRARATRDSAGRTIRVEGTDLDITERKENEAIIQASEERYRRLMEVLPNAVFVNSGGKIVFCNPSCIQLFGATDADQILGRSPFEFFHPDYHSSIQQRIDSMLGKDESVPGLEERIVRIDGRVVPVHVVGTPIRDGASNAVLIALSDLTERERSVTLLRSVLDSVTDAILTVDENGSIQSANPATEQIFGYTQCELVGQNLKMLMPSPFYEEHDSFIANFIRSGIAKMIGIGREVSGRRKDGSIFPAELIVAAFELEGERRFTGVVRDITSRKQLEEQFLQAQKMEAVGQLAGGVAHDFNNLLTVINGYAQLLQAKLSSDNVMSEYASLIREAGERAAGLTAQLLAFSRKTILAPKVLDINESVEQFAKMLHRLLGEDIAFSTCLQPHLSSVKVDPGQLEQVLMNLAVNARDAMPCGGRLKIDTSEITLAANHSQTKEMKPGRYIQIRMTDTGTGISKEVQSRMFEPFFTTKEVGKGTGLGLATVYGIVKQAGGSIKVESEPGQGTTFIILLPAVYEEQNTEQSRFKKIKLPKGSETILVVEDEPAVLRLVRFVLESHGYQVIAASDGPSAIAAAMAHNGTIDLLLTDVVMPGMSGREIAEAFRERWPDSKIIYTSGYTADTVVRYGVETAVDDFIQKPFTPRALVGKVQQTLDRPSSMTSAADVAEVVRVQFGSPASSEQIEEASLQKSKRNAES